MMACSQPLPWLLLQHTLSDPHTAQIAVILCLLMILLLPTSQTFTDWYKAPTSSHWRALLGFLWGIANSLYLKQFIITKNSWTPREKAHNLIDYWELEIQERLPILRDPKRVSFPDVIDLSQPPLSQGLFQTSLFLPWILVYAACLSC